MPADKQSLLILTFLIVFGVSAAITITGALPKIFETNEKVNQAVIQQHEDEGRANQTIKISQHVDEKIDQMLNNLTDFITVSANRSTIGAIERGQILDSILDVANKQTIVAKDHSKLSKGISNITNQTLDLLNKFNSNIGNRELLIENKVLLENLTDSVDDLKATMY